MKRRKRKFCDRDWGETRLLALLALQAHKARARELIGTSYFHFCVTNPYLQISRGKNERQQKRFWSVVTEVAGQSRDPMVSFPLEHAGYCESEAPKLLCMWQNVVNL